MSEHNNPELPAIPEAAVREKLTNAERTGIAFGIYAIVAALPVIPVALLFSLIGVVTDELWGLLLALAVTATPLVTAVTAIVLGGRPGRTLGIIGLILGGISAVIGLAPVLSVF